MGFFVISTRRVRLLPVALAVLPISACFGDKPTAPNPVEPAYLAVQTTTLGSKLFKYPNTNIITDPFTFNLAVDGVEETVIGTNDYLIFRRPEPGEVEVGLSDLGAWCGVVGENPLRLTVPAGQTVTANFEIFCESGLDVTVTTVGTDIDADGYRVVLNPQMSFWETVDLGLAPHKTIDLWKGPHWIALIDVAPNCSVVTPNPDEFELPGGAFVPVAFDVTCVTPPPLPGHLVFSSNRVSGLLSESRLYRMNADGTNVVELTLPASFAGSAHEPAVSLDGTKVVFRDFEWLYLINADGTGFTQLTSEAAGHPRYARWPAWSPDGSKIAFSSSAAGNWDIYLINADGSGLVQLTHHPEADHHPTWSPDGAMIAFSGRRKDGDGGSRGHLFIVNVDGSNPREVDIEVDVSEPTWSPDGQRFAFVSWVSAFSTELFVVGQDGSELKAVTNTPADVAEPAWSPDGSMIVYRETPWRYADWDPELYIITADGQRLANVSNTPGVDSEPAWSK